MSVLEHVLNAANVVGNALDTPASMIRSALIGENPLTAAVDTSQRRSMRDVLERYGVLGPNEQGLDAGDAAAFALNMAIDPLNWIGGLGFVKNLLKSRALSKMDDAVEPGFSPELIKHLTGRNVSPVNPDDYTGWIDSLPINEKDSIIGWSLNDHMPINHLLRGKTLDRRGREFGISDLMANAEDPEIVMHNAKVKGDLIAQALGRSPVPRDSRTYRATGANFFKDKNVGDVIDDPGFVATSIGNLMPGKHKLGSFYGVTSNPTDALVDVVIPKGSKGGLIDPISEFEGHHSEFLLNKGGKYRIVAKRDLPLVSVKGTDDMPPYDWDWQRGKNPEDVEWPFGSVGSGYVNLPDSIRASQTTRRVYRNTQPNYLVELIDGDPSLSAFIHRNMPGNQAILSALAGYNTARGFSGNQ